MGVKARLHGLWSLTLDGGEPLASFSGHFPAVRHICIHWTKGWTGPEVSLDMVTEGKIPVPVGN